MTCFKVLLLLVKLPCRTDSGGEPPENIVWIGGERSYQRPSHANTTYETMHPLPAIQDKLPVLSLNH